MNRYTPSSTNVFNRFDGKRVFRTTTYPPIPVSDNDLYMVCTEATYLDALAYKYYKDASLWWVIAQANGIKATLKAPTGVQLRIPANIQSIMFRFDSANS